MSGSVCVGFYYHMYGAGMGSLYLHSLAAGGSSTREDTLVWARSGHQAITWLHAFVGINSVLPGTKVNRQTVYNK